MSPLQREGKATPSGGSVRDSQARRRNRTERKRAAVDIAVFFVALFRRKAISIDCECELESRANLSPDQLLLLHRGTRMDRMIRK
ncbi:hypothetical protein MHYP_G00314080 [Metynnis hypsauchen]